jgi:hypothetical protein
VGRFILGLVIGSVAAGLVAVGVLAQANRPCPDCNNIPQLVAISRDLNVGDTIEAGDWYVVPAIVPPATTKLYFMSNEQPLFLGLQAAVPLHAGELLAKSDVTHPDGLSAVVPLTFKVAPGNLKSGDSVCIYYADGTALRIFYLTPLVVTATPIGWQAKVRPTLAPDFLYAAAYMDLAAFGSPASGTCPAAPIFAKGPAYQAPPPLRP